MKQRFYIAGLAAATLLASCKPDLKVTAPSAGKLDFSTYIAVGNSLTAGYASNSLYRSGQENSYPSILATQFKTVGGGDFKQPLLTGEHGYPSPRLILGPGTDCMGNTSLGPVADTGGVNPEDATNIAAEGPFNNLGVPGIRAVDYIIPGYPSLNPYSKRFFSNLGATPLEELRRMQPTFFTCWVGSNDVLGYATSGGEGTVGGSLLNPQNISDQNLFAVAYDSVMNVMTATGAKGAVMNIPDVTSIPFFTTVPHNGLTLTAEQAAGLTAAYAPLGITFTAGANNFIIQDVTAPGGKRQMYDDELVLLDVPQDSLKCAGWGSLTPIPKQYILSRDEIANVKTATTAFNSIIQQEAQAHGLAYVDMNTYLKTLSSGIGFNGVTYSTTFVTGGAFSLDGVHLTPRGYALAANFIIRTINTYYGSNVPQADVNKYSGLIFP